jgi:iron(III) transport system substrate-binding protein
VPKDLRGWLERIVRVAEIFWPRCRSQRFRIENNIREVSDMVRKNLFLLILCAGFLNVSGLAWGQTPLETLYREAKAEGEVTVWSPLEEVGGILAGEFAKDYPAIKVNFFEIRPSDYVTRVVAEARQGIVSLDMSTSTLRPVSALIERDLIQAHDDWTDVFKELNPAAVSQDGRFLAFSDLVYIVAYNTELVKPDEVPTSWDDLLAPKWKGKIILEPRANAFAYLGLKWGEKKMTDYVGELKRQNPLFVKGGTGVLQRLIAGAAPLAVGGYAYRLLQLKNAGAPIDWAKKVSPIAAATQHLFIMKGSRHPNSARLFAGWLASDRAQGILNTKKFMGAVNPGSAYSLVREMERNNVEVVKESTENYEQTGKLSKLATKSLGVLR